VSKQDFIDRQLAIHAVDPITSYDEETHQEVEMSNEEVTQSAGEWYDIMVEQNKSSV